MTKYKVLDIAQWFVNRGALDAETNDEQCYVTNLKIQKLLYYAQACCLAFYNRELFKEKIEAWQYGPVIPVVYNKYKVCSNQPVKYKEPVYIDKDISILLEFIYEKFGQQPTSKLVDLTHEDSSYIKAINTNNKIYDINSIKKDFEEKWLASVDIEQSKKEYSAMAETSFINSIDQLNDYLIKEKETTKDTVNIDWKTLLDTK